PPERTGVFIPSTDGNGAGESADRDRNGGGEVEGPVAALPGVARPPALHRAVPKERARELVASSNAGRCGETTDFDRNGGVVEGPVAELPELVPPHALHRPVRKAHTGILTSGRNCDGGDGFARGELLRLTDANGGIGWRYGESGRPSHLSPQAQPKAAEARGDEPQRSIKSVTHWDYVYAARRSTHSRRTPETRGADSPSTRLGKF